MEATRIAIAPLAGFTDASGRARRHSATPQAPSESATSTSSVGLPRLSSASKARISTICMGRLYMSVN